MQTDCSAESRSRKQSGCIDRGYNTNESSVKSLDFFQIPSPRPIIWAIEEPYRPTLSARDVNWLAYESNVCRGELTDLSNVLLDSRTDKL